MQLFHFRRLPAKFKPYFLVCLFIIMYCIVSFSLEVARYSITEDSSDQQTMIFMRNGTILEGVSRRGKLIQSNFSYSCHNNCKASVCYINNSIVPSWKHRNLIKHSGNPRYLAFDQTISDSEWSELIELLDIFRHACARSSLSYFLYGGSLLGAYRHFGVIPWDDDVDVMLNSSDRGTLNDILSNIPGYSLFTPSNMQWKFYRHNPETPKSIPNYEESRNESNNNFWPYLDIFFFDWNDTHIWDNNPMYSSVYKFRKSDIFPLTLLPFESLIVTVPRRTDVILEQSYNVNLCVSPSFSHRFERQNEQRQMSLPCKRLFPYLTFVTSENRGDYSIRKLKLSDRALFYEIVTDSL